MTTGANEFERETLVKWSVVRATGLRPPPPGTQGERGPEAARQIGAWAAPLLRAAPPVSRPSPRPPIRDKLPGMNCPVCKTPTLAATDLPTGGAVALSARHCNGCGGHWVAGDVYLLWVAKNAGGPPPIHEQVDAADPVAAAKPAAVAAEESAKAKICPTCGRLLSRSKVGHGLAFHLDRCVTCGGFWFDAGEWDALLARNLHDDAHHIFSPAWQADVMKHERRLQHDRLMIAKLGEADWREIRRVKAWLDAHPHRAELHAVLREE